MRLTFILTVSSVLAMTAGLEAQEVLKFDVGQQSKKTVFAGGEARLAAYNYVLSNCTSGPRPDVRVLKSPANGDLRFDQITVPIDRAKDNRRAHCNGKDVEAVGVYYKPKEGFTGEDRITIDTDWKNGSVSRYTYVVNVR